MSSESHSLILMSISTSFIQLPFNLMNEKKVFFFILYSQLILSIYTIHYIWCHNKDTFMRFI